MTNQKDCLTQLPKELILHILQIVCADGTSAVVNQSLLALRCCKLLRIASDSARASITLCRSNLDDAAPLLSKLTGLFAITIRGPVQTSPNPNTPDPTATIPILLSCSSLRRISENVPTLVSLTVDSGGDKNFSMFASSLTQLLWQHSLMHLNLHRCTLLTSIVEAHNVCNQMLSAELGSWSPDLPNLTTLAITEGLLTSLDLVGCPHLQELEMIGNVELSHLKLWKGGALRCVMIAESRELEELDMSGFGNLRTLKLSYTSRVANLDLTGCTALQQLECFGADCLANLCLSDCCSLEQAYVRGSDVLLSLDLTCCTNLQQLSCDINSALIAVHLPPSSTLETLDFNVNARLVSLELAGCAGLKSLTVRCNHGLIDMDLSRLGALEEVLCCKNRSLSSVKAVECQALWKVMCSTNPALTSLDMSGCKALSELKVPDNPSLTSLDINGCNQLEYLDRSNCARLTSVDMSSCPNVFLFGGP